MPQGFAQRQMDEQGQSRHQAGAEKQRIEPEPGDDQFGKRGANRRADDSGYPKDPQPFIETPFRDQVGHAGESRRQAYGKAHAVNDANRQEREIKLV